MIKLSKPEYKDLERTLAGIYETGITDRKTPLRFSFSKGLIGGLGVVLGSCLIGFGKN